MSVIADDKVDNAETELNRDAESRLTELHLCGFEHFLRVHRQLNAVFVRLVNGKQTVNNVEELTDSRINKIVYLCEALF